MKMLFVINVAFLLLGCTKFTNTEPATVEQRGGLGFETDRVTVHGVQYFMQITWVGTVDQVQQRGLLLLIPWEQWQRLQPGTGGTLDGVEISAGERSIAIRGFEGKVILYDLDKSSLRLLADSWPEALRTEPPAAKDRMIEFLNRVIEPKSD